LLGERDPSPRAKPQQRFAEALELAVAKALELAFAEALDLAAIDELLRERWESRLAFGLPFQRGRFRSGAISEGGGSSACLIRHSR
jgi:hypothetical protein